MKALILTSYRNYKGGVNNLQVSTVRLEYKSLRSEGVIWGDAITFTSVHDKAESRAESWIKKHGHELVR